MANEVVQMPSIPNAQELPAVRDLCSLADPYAFSPESDALFVEAMKQITRWHSVRSEFYSKALAASGTSVDSLNTVEDCARLPYIPAEFFKQHEVVSIARDQVSLHLTSSGTTGQKSQMFFDDWSIRAPQKMVERIFQKMGWVTSTPANYLLYTYEVESDSKLGTAFTDYFLCGFAPVKDAFCALRRNGKGSHDFDIFGSIEKFQAYARDSAPVRIYGFPAFLYFTLKRMKDLKIAPLQLSPNSLVFLGGGWKGHANQAVSREELYSLVTELLGIPDERIRDGFGSVEHCIPYVECSRHRFHVPVWSRVFIRDIKTLQPVGYEQQGFLSFVSPYITSVPAQSVVMGDLATLYPADACPCGTGTPYFVVHGRAGTSKNKSCAIAASELLKGVV